MNMNMNAIDSYPAGEPATSKALSCYFATDLSQADLPDMASDEDIILQGKAFRRLTPAFYAWLRRQMETARERHERGLLPEAHYEPLKTRFNAMHDVALAIFGEATLLAYCRDTAIVTYEPPVLRMSRDASVLLQDAEKQAGQARQTVPSPDPGARDIAGTAIDAPCHGLRVQAQDGQWTGVIVQQYPADEWLPHGWAEVRLDDGRVGSADLRALRHADGTPLVAHPTYTAYEQRAMVLAREERPEDFDDLIASLPILAFVAPGDWPFEESPSFEDFLKVNDIRERAQALGWTDADLFQTSGRFKFPCGQDYGLVCFLRGRTIGEITANGVALLPDKPGGAVLTFARPQRAPAPKEVSDEPIHEALSERGAAPAQAVAAGVTTLRRRQDALCAVSSHSAGVQSPESVGPAHAGTHAHRHRPSAGHESAKRVPDSQGRQTTGADHPCLVF